MYVDGCRYACFLNNINAKCYFMPGVLFKTNMNGFSIFTAGATYHNEALEPFFPKLFARGKCLFIADRTRVGCLVSSFSVYRCVRDSACLSATFVHGAPRTRHRCQCRRALCTHTPTKPSRAGAIVRRSELVEPGTATWVGRHMSALWFKKTEQQNILPGKVFVWRST